MSASGSVGPGLPGEVENILMKFFNLGARRGGDLLHLIARL